MRRINWGKVELRVEIDSPYGKVVFYPGMMITVEHYTSSTKIHKNSIINVKCLNLHLCFPEL